MPSPSAADGLCGSGKGEGGGGREGEQSALDVVKNLAEDDEEDAGVSNLEEMRFEASVGTLEWNRG